MNVFRFSPIYIFRNDPKVSNRLGTQIRLEKTLDFFESFSNMNDMNKSNEDALVFQLGDKPAFPKPVLNVINTETRKLVSFRINKKVAKALKEIGIAIEG